jgi:hypothetical protein
MKKIMITESQLEMIKKSLNEGVSDTYNQNVDVNIEYYGVKIDGENIDYVNDINIPVTYNIEVEARDWGIKGISLYNVKGPEEIELGIIPETDNNEEKNVTIKLNWDDVEIERETGHGIVTIDNTITIHLSNDDNGNIICDGITVTEFGL